MGNIKKFKEKILNGKSDANIQFKDLCQWLLHEGFTLSLKGSSHHIFKKSGFPIINIQPRKDGKAKAYQIQQIRKVYDEKKDC